MSQKNQTTFFSFLKRKDNYLDWTILSLTTIIGLIVIKSCYPFPMTISDSGTYVNAALTDQFSFYRPFGYSYFLQILHTVSHSVHAVTVVQYLLLFVSVTFLSFTIKYFFPPTNKWLWYTILFFMVFNPIAFFMANAIMSDLLFGALIYIILASFVFIVKKPNWAVAAILIVSVFLLLHVRYSAMVFPFLFIVLFLIMLRGKYRWIMVVGVALVSMLFYNQVKNSMEKTVGVRQFSTGFDGWQMANNGLHVLPFIKLDPKDIKDDEVRVLYQVWLPFKDKIYAQTKGGTYPSANFMWSNDQPLKQYAFFYAQQTRQPYPYVWVKLGSGAYKKYGTYFITHYPIEFMKYFYLPNLKQVVYPTEFETLQYSESVSGKPDIMSWYEIPADAIATPKHDIYNDFVLSYIQKSTSIIWAIAALTIILAVVFIKRFSLDRTDWMSFIGVLLFLGLYYFSTVFAGPVMLRFWVSTTTILFMLMYILLNQIVVKPKTT